MHRLSRTCSRSVPTPTTSHRRRIAVMVGLLAVLPACRAPETGGVPTASPIETSDRTTTTASAVVADSCRDVRVAFFSDKSLSTNDEDSDGDGYSVEEGDCAWWDATTYPGAPERADWNDNDCDGTTDEGCDGSCNGYYDGGCHDDYEWYYLGTSSTPTICDG